MIKPRVWLEVDLESIVYNFNQIKQYVAPLKVMAVLKANAYGLGVDAIAEALTQNGVDAIGVAELSEALTVTPYGIPTYILGAILPEEILTAAENNIIIPVSDLEIAQQVNLVGISLGRPVKIAILLDTGMGRLGVVSDHTVILNEIKKLPMVEVDSIYSHFSVAYEDSTYSNRQVAKFLEIVEPFKADQVDLHIANSDGINNIPYGCQSPFTMVRSGINLYGVHDLCGANQYQLKETITLKSRLVAIRLLEAGSPIGYGQTFTLSRPTVIGTVAAGYADGIPVSASNSGEIVVHRKKCPIIGRVSMDYITVDLSEVEDIAKVGDEVILLGEGITVEDWALLANSIPYQVICSFG
ncbi:MAG: alanine racemase, partial [Lentisphaeria bacterium]|nr:alanine racemase [Lentisphaeria bacterium]